MRRVFLGVALIGIASLVLGSMWTQVGQVSATSSVTMLNETFNAQPASPWILGGAASTVAAGYPKVETRNTTNRLRLTRAVGSEGGYALYDDPLPTTGGLDITFQFEMWGGGSNGADGIGFLIVDGATSGIQVGALGGGLGYVNLTGTGGQGALLGIGLDRWGGFRSAVPSGGSAPSDCSTSFGFGLWADAITARGPGTSGYNVISSSNPCSSFFGDYKQNRGDAWTVRSNRERTARIVIDPSTAANPQVKVYLDDPHGDDLAGGNFTGTAGILDSSTPRVTFAQPAELLSATSFKFGFVAATGGAANNHDILGLSVATLQPLPAVRWTTAATLPGGTIGVAYSQTLNGADGLPAYSYSLVSGSLPAGLSLSGGVITGTPTGCEDATFTLRVADRQSPASTADRTFTIRVNDAQQACTYVVPTTSTTPAATTSTMVSAPTTTFLTTVVGETTTTTQLSVIAATKTSEPAKLPRTGFSMPFAVVSVAAVGIGRTVLRRRRH